MCAQPLMSPYNPHTHTNTRYCFYYNQCSKWHEWWTTSNFNYLPLSEPSPPIRTMMLLLTCPANCEVGRVIYFLHGKWAESLSIHCEILFVYCFACMTIQMVHYWVKAFDKECTQVHNAPYSGRPSVLVESEWELNCRCSRNVTHHSRLSEVL